jgi:hypothetical protein
LKKGRKNVWQHTCFLPVEMLPDVACGFSFFVGLPHTQSVFVVIGCFCIFVGLASQRGRIRVFLLLNKTSDLKI